MKILVVLIFILGIMELAFDVKDNIVSMLGRRSDLTTRVPMWEDLLLMVKNPIIGFGYESFWLGDRLIYMVNKWGIKNQAHNGYLEMYLNMGLIGVFFIVGWIVSGLRKVYRYLDIDYSAAVLRFCFIVIVTIYNWTEATFYGNNNMWSLFFFGVMDMVRRIEKDMPLQQFVSENNSHK
jgi:O-antigen ligase